MSGFDLRGLCLISNRHLCAEPLEERAGKVLFAGASYLMLREKDLPAPQLCALAQRLARVAARHGGRLIVNSSVAAAEAAGAWGLQLPFDLFLKLRGDERLKRFSIGVSVHSLEEARTAEALGADRVLAGHVFATDCKAGVPGRGLDFVRVLRRNLRLPLWAVGGLRPENAEEAIQAGADVLCVMSALLMTNEPVKMTEEYLKRIQDDTQ